MFLFIKHCSFLYFLENKDTAKKLSEGYGISDLIYRILAESFVLYVLYTSSSGFLLFSFIFLKWLGVNPVTLLNWELR